MANGTPRSVIIPIDKIPDEEYFDKVTRVFQEKALALASKLIPKGNLVIRELKPEDLGLTGNEWSFDLAAAGENTIVDANNFSGGKLPDDTLIVIYGVYNLSTNPQVTEVKFGTPAGTLADVYLEHLYMFDHQAGILQDLVVIRPSQTPVIKAIAKAAGTEKLGFLGFVIEPAGKTISP